MVWDYSLQPSNTYKTASFRIWVPDSGTVKGLICITPGLDGDGRPAYEDSKWRALAKEINFGIIGCFFQDIDSSCYYCVADNGSGDALLEAIEVFAKEHNRDDVKNAKLLMWGHSAGGQFNFNFACWKPEKVMAFVVNKGAHYYDRLIPRATKKIPALLFLGIKDEADRIENIRRLAKKNPHKWKLIEEDVAHDVGQSDTLSIEFFKKIVQK